MELLPYQRCHANTGASSCNQLWLQKAKRALPIATTIWGKHQTALSYRIVVVKKERGLLKPLSIAQSIE